MSAAPVYVACLTPPGTAAIATVGLVGDGAWSLVEPLFQPRGKKTGFSEKPGFWVGRLGNEFADDVVLTLQGHGDRRRVEIHCHGGSAVVRWLIDLFTSRGAIEIRWDDWQRQSAISPLKAETAIALARALTARAAGILLDQYHGALERELHEIDSAIAHGDKAQAKSKLDGLIRRIPIGKHLTEPWRVVVAGAPNAGKSTLVNALLGYQRAITSSTPGTTRDILTALTAFDGWPVELIDTAGLRPEALGLEALGVERAVNALTQADLCLWIVDRTEAQPVLPPTVLVCPVLLVCNKADLSPRWRPWTYNGTSWDVSALTGQGLPDLIGAVAMHLVPDPLSPGAAVPFTDEMCRLIVRRSLETD